MNSLMGASNTSKTRMSTGISEFDRVLGGGLVCGSFVLIGGEPGVGKSTLMLQACRNFAKAGLTVMYVSAEESTQQVLMRAVRLGEFPSSFNVACESNYEIIEDYVRNNKCDILIVDSIQVFIYLHCWFLWVHSAADDLHHVTSLVPGLHSPSP